MFPVKGSSSRKRDSPSNCIAVVEGEGRTPQKGVMDAGGWEQPFLLSLCSEAAHGVRIAACRHREEKELERPRSWDCLVTSFL